jgi:hypothetical protein
VRKQLAISSWQLAEAHWYLIALLLAIGSWLLAKSAVSFPILTFNFGDFFLISVIRVDQP